MLLETYHVSNKHLYFGALNDKKTGTYDETTTVFLSHVGCDVSVTNEEPAFLTANGVRGCRHTSRRDKKFLIDLFHCIS